MTPPYGTLGQTGLADFGKCLTRRGFAVSFGFDLQVLGVPEVTTCKWWVSRIGGNNGDPGSQGAERARFVFQLYDFYAIIQRDIRDAERVSGLIFPPLIRINVFDKYFIYWRPVVGQRAQ